MVKNIHSAGLPAIGFSAAATEKDNGELHVECIHETGSGYMWTESPVHEESGWQDDAHFHCGVSETFIVERGMMAFATYQIRLGHSLTIYGPGEIVTAEPNVQHNLYLYKDTVIHAVRHGKQIGNSNKNGADWYPAEEAFDAWTKGLSEDDILNQSVL